MFIRILTIATLALSGSAIVFGGTCDCNPEIGNASAKVSNICSKIWSNNHCTLIESKNSTARLHQRFGNNLSLGIERLESTLVPIFNENYWASFTHDANPFDFDSPISRELAERFTSAQYIINLEWRCRRQESVELSDLVMLLISPLLTFDDEGSVSLMSDSEAISSLVEAVITNKVATKMCTSTLVDNTHYSNGILFFGGGCIGYGNSDTYIATDVGNFSDCLRSMNFY